MDLWTPVQRPHRHLPPLPLLASSCRTLAAAGRTQLERSTENKLLNALCAQHLGGQTTWGCRVRSGNAPLRVSVSGSLSNHIKRETLSLESTRTDPAACAWVARAPQTHRIPGTLLQGLLQRLHQYPPGDSI